MCAFACSMDMNSVTFKHSSLSRPLNDSHRPLGAIGETLGAVAVFVTRAIYRPNSH
jgi:hypothetical protein